MNDIAEALAKMAARAADLSKDEVRSLAHQFGRHRMQVTSGLCWLLPYVESLGIAHEDGCANLYEWAAKFGGMSKKDVDRVQSLFRRLGRFDCLWDLLLQGTGLSKLERVAPHVSADNASWLAEQVARLPKPQLEQLLRSLKVPASGACSAKAATASLRPGSAMQPARPPLVGIALHANALQDSDALQTAVATPPGVIPPADATPASICPGSPDGAEIAAAFEGVDVRSLDRPNLSIRLSLELDPLGEKHIRELHEICQRAYGRPIGLGELFVLLARDAVARQEIPVLPGVRELAARA
ncbi:MAG: hypothetical protein KGR26_02550, partial [Cyanobacteria bacterium REEB65]|nr:hypothetical protein [Cyanobacteria bacterium REEB65]